VCFAISKCARGQSLAESYFTLRLAATATQNKPALALCYISLDHHRHTQNNQHDAAQVETSAAADELRPLFHDATPPRQTQKQNQQVSKVPKLQI
jgi:hypothetical protein